MSLNAILCLLALVVAMVYPTGAEPLWIFESASPRLAGLALTLAIVALYWMWAAVSYRVLPAERYRVRALNRGLALIAFAAIIFTAHLPWVVEVSWSVSLTQLAAVAPFPAMLGMDALHARLWERSRGYVRRGAAFELRLLVALGFIPAALMLGFLEALAQIEPLRRLTFVYPFTLWLGVLAMVSVLAVAAPYLLRWILGARSLPSGELRDRLSALCGRAGFRYGDLLIVDTAEAKLGTAFIVGSVGPLRYVFFTDHLLRHLTPDETECVLAHEIGHVKKMHLPAFFFYSAASVIVAGIVYQLLTIWIKSEEAAALAVTPLFILVWILVFGFISRRFETEADLYGAKLCGDPDRFMAMLGKVSVINRMPLQAGSLRHFSPAERINLLAMCKRNKLFEFFMEKWSEMIRRWCFYSFMMCVIYASTLVFKQIRFAAPEERRYLAHVMAEQGRRALQERDYATAERKLQAAARETRAGAHYLYLARAQAELGKRDEAAKNLELAAKAGLRHPLDRLMHARLAP